MTFIAHLKKHPDQSNSLFAYHQQSIEFWLYKELFAIIVHDDPNAEMFKHLYTSATLVDFEQFRDIHHLIPQALDRKEHSDYPQIEDTDKWEIYVKYRKIVSRFLIDQSRYETWSRNHQHSIYRPFLNNLPITVFRWSGSEEHYVSLAKYLLSSLSEGLE